MSLSPNSFPSSCSSGSYFSLLYPPTPNKGHDLSTFSSLLEPHDESKSLTTEPLMLMEPLGTNFSELSELFGSFPLVGFPTGSIILNEERDSTDKKFFP